MLWSPRHCEQNCYIWFAPLYRILRRLSTMFYSIHWSHLYCIHVVSELSVSLVVWTLIKLVFQNVSWVCVYKNTTGIIGAVGRIETIKTGSTSLVSDMPKSDDMSETAQLIKVMLKQQQQRDDQQQQQLLQQREDQQQQQLQQQKRHRLRKWTNSLQRGLSNTWSRSLIQPDTL